MLENYKQKFPKLYKNLFTVTTFSKILALSLFIILPFLGFYLGINYKDKVVNETVPQAIKDNSNKKVVSDNFQIDNARSKPEVCGYTEEITEKILKAQGVPSNKESRMGTGIWSNDCRKFVYGFHPPKYRGSDAAWAKSLEDNLDGIWLYDAEKNSATKITTNFFAPPNKWLTYELISAGENYYIDVNTKRIYDTKEADPIEPYKAINWIMYKNSKFPWSFMHPKKWKVIEEIDQNKDGIIDKVGFERSENGVRIAFHSTIPNAIDINKYSKESCGFLLTSSQYEIFEIYCSKSLDPARILINKKDPNYPSMISFGWNSDEYPTQLEVNRIGIIIPTITNNTIE